MAEKILLLHGIWNAKAWLNPLAARLRAAGFDAQVFGYPSVMGGPEVAVPSLIAHLRNSGPVAVVGHSLGGLITLEALRQAPDLPVSRVVCLGSPLRGSGAARGLAAVSYTHLDVYKRQVLHCWWRELLLWHWMGRWPGCVGGTGAMGGATPCTEANSARQPWLTKTWPCWDCQVVPSTHGLAVLESCRTRRE